MINSKRSRKDASIFVPHTSDKRAVFEITEAIYQELIKNCIQVYK